ncbi:hypothetical protein [Klebsiella pneumoniae]|uniref:hypothetical protein n=1 Tax=Klebsiella pneumoniae TaxID=573 RepID=UPI00294A4538|nr:hypothetical protein [Klebsiella pneumoniae]MDV5417907.1 hypothetical protein [Klebsiella pneumoniae]
MKCLSGKPGTDSAAGTRQYAANEYCSGQKIAIPAYSTLQKIISQVVGDEQEHMAAHLERAMSRGLKQALAELVVL